jgi:hypothetical protein
MQKDKQKFSRLVLPPAVKRMSNLNKKIVKKLKKQSEKSQKQFNCLLGSRLLSTGQSKKDFTKEMQN